MTAHKELDDAQDNAQDDAQERLRNLINESSFGEDIAQLLSRRTLEQDVTEAVRQADGTVPLSAPGSVHPSEQSFLGSLTEAERAALLASAEQVVYPAGAVVWSEGQIADRVVVIQSGLVGVSVSRNNEERVVAFHGPGDIFGERAILLMRQHSPSVVAMDAVRGLRMTPQRFVAYLDDHPRVLGILEGVMYGRLNEPDSRPAPHAAPPGVQPMPIAHQVQQPIPAPGRAADPSWAGQNCTIAFTDIVGFSDARRTDHDRHAIRRTMYALLREAFESSDVPWDGCHLEDRGDGALIIVPPEVPTATVVDPMIASLATLLRRHNKRSSGALRFQLRVAVDVGPVFPEPTGLSAWAVIRTARLLDAPPLKNRLAATGADLGFITSRFVYESVIAHRSGNIDPAEYEAISVKVKKDRTEGWIHLPGAQTAQADETMDIRGLH